MSPDDVLKFWFDEHTAKDWFGGKAEFDDQVEASFADLLVQAEKCELFHWRRTPQGRLAEIIILDQFTRQLFRGQPRAFASDPLALALAQEAVATGDDLKLQDRQRPFLYMPFMHSESLAIQDQSIVVFTTLGNVGDLDFAKKHRAVIERFGRFPKRNAALGRISSAEEQAYMAGTGDSMF
uniref:DUF924 family protein n=1 Tax=Pararhizobium sp. IMCC3301 TaxID=3067904 RepID=UPI0027409A90|nr:DUF924 family protein [Pararhizobium sp. IMCC3301]